MNTRGPARTRRRRTMYPAFGMQGPYNEHGSFADSLQMMHRPPPSRLSQVKAFSHDGLPSANDWRPSSQPATQSARPLATKLSNTSFEAAVPSVPHMSLEQMTGKRKESPNTIKTPAAKRHQHHHVADIHEDRYSDDVSESPRLPRGFEDGLRNNFDLQGTQSPGRWSFKEHTGIRGSSIGNSWEGRDQFLRSPSPDESMNVFQNTESAVNEETRDNNVVEPSHSQSSSEEKSSTLPLATASEVASTDQVRSYDSLQSIQTPSCSPTKLLEIPGEAVRQGSFSCDSVLVNVLEASTEKIAELIVEERGNLSAPVDVLNKSTPQALIQGPVELEMEPPSASTVTMTSPLLTTPISQFEKIFLPTDVPLHTDRQPVVSPSELTTGAVTTSTQKPTESVMEQYLAVTASPSIDLNDQSDRRTSTYAFIPEVKPFSLTAPSQEELQAVPPIMAPTETRLTRYVRDSAVKTLEILIEDASARILDEVYLFDTYVEPYSLSEFFTFYSQVSGIPIGDLTSLVFVTTFGRREKKVATPTGERGWRSLKAVMQTLFVEAQRADPTKMEFEIMVRVA